MSSFESQPEVSEAGFPPMDIAPAIPKADESSMQVDAKSLPLCVQKTEPPNVEDKKEALKASILMACETIGAGYSSEELGYDPDKARRDVVNFLVEVADSVNYDTTAIKASLRAFCEMARDVIPDPPTAA